MPFLSTPAANGSRARSPAISILSTTHAANGSNAASEDNSLTSSPMTYNMENNPADSSSSNHSPRSWLREGWLNVFERHESIAQGFETMTVHIVDGLHLYLEDVVDYLPVASLYGGRFRGWTRKSQTWPVRRVARRRSF